MGRTYEGMVEIPMEDFWGFVSKYLPINYDSIVYGKPRVDKGNDCLEVDFAGDSEGDPHGWAVRPVALTQWEED